MVDALPPEITQQPIQPPQQHTAPDWASHEDMQANLAQAAFNGRLNRLTLIVVTTIFLTVLVSSFQNRHHWPVLVPDIGYALGVGVVVFAAVLIFHVGR